MVFVLISDWKSIQMMETPLHFLKRDFGLNLGKEGFQCFYCAPR